MTSALGWRDKFQGRARAHAGTKGEAWKAPVSVRGEHAKGRGEDAPIQRRPTFSVFLRSLTVHRIPLAKNVSWELVT